MDVIRWKIVEKCSSISPFILKPISQIVMSIQGVAFSNNIKSIHKFHHYTDLSVQEIESNLDWVRYTECNDGNHYEKLIGKRTIWWHESLTLCIKILRQPVFIFSNCPIHRYVANAPYCEYARGEHEVDVLYYIWKEKISSCKNHNTINLKPKTCLWQWKG